jgi:hypothetical protein
MICNISIFLSDISIRNKIHYTLFQLFNTLVWLLGGLMNYLGRDLAEIQKRFNDLWKQIKAKYPKADGKLHLAFKGEFVGLNESFGSIIKNNHYVFAESEAKEKARALFKANKDAPEEEFKKILQNAPLNSHCEISVIWGDLDYDLIAQLQIEPLVDQNLTPKTRASIRIVLGVIGEKG